jgi:hypothetical protein
MKEEVNKIFTEMNLLWRNLNRCRGYFPFVDDSSVGEKVILTPPYYQAQGISIIHSFDELLTLKKKNEINEIGHWINQNFVIRLYSLMECHHMLSACINIDFELNGAEHLNIVRRLRNRFTHSSGSYNSDDSDDVKTMELIRDHLGIPIVESIDWPLAIDTVLENLLEGCKMYVKAKIKSS